MLICHIIIILRVKNEKLGKDSQIHQKFKKFKKITPKVTQNQKF